jgi:hypothetical protein
MSSILAKINIEETLPGWSIGIFSKIVELKTKLK